MELGEFLQLGLDEKKSALFVWSSQDVADIPFYAERLLLALEQKSPLIVSFEPRLVETYWELI